MTDSIEQQAAALRRQLESHFAADTAAQGFPWRSDAPGTGHCAVVALIAHIRLGAEIYSAQVHGVSHWFSRFRSAESTWDVDVTGDQFGAPPVQVAPADELYPGGRARSLMDVDAETLGRTRRLAERAGLTDIARTFEVIGELLILRRCFDRWSALPSTRRSGPPATELVEEPLRAFFARAAPNGVLVGKGDRPTQNDRSSDLDIVFDYENASWFARFRMDVQNSPVLAHLDVSARGEWDASKLLQDLSRVQQTIDEARRIGQKTWTGLVALGSGFGHRNADVMERLHEFHHDRSVEQWDAPSIGSVWPFVDALVIPGMLFKKHDLFERPALDAARVPVLYPFPARGYPGLEDLWPLVPAREFLASYLRKATNKELWDAPAWSDSETSVILGHGDLDGSWPTDWRVVALRDAVPSELHHWTGRPDHPWQDHVLFGDVTCSSHAAYTLLPRPTFSLTKERRKLLLALLRQDPRWHQLTDTGSRLVAELDFPDALKDEIDRIIDGAKALGYEAAAHLRLVKAKGATSPRTFSVSFSVPEKSPATFTSIERLRSLLHPNLARAKHISPQLQIATVERWLGDQGLRWDVAEAIWKPFGNGIVIAFHELATRDSIVLLVLGDAVERLPVSL